MLNKCLVKLTIARFMLKEKMSEFLHDENGEVNIIAIIIILAIAIALAIIFRNQIKDLFDSIWGAINGAKDKAIQEY